MMGDLVERALQRHALDALTAVLLVDEAAGRRVGKRAVDMTGGWQKSSYSNRSGNCVEGTTLTAAPGDGLDNLRSLPRVDVLARRAHTVILGHAAPRRRPHQRGQPGRAGGAHRSAGV
jgi:hypothetical protein